MCTRAPSNVGYCGYLMCEMSIGLAFLFWFSATGFTGLCTSARLSRGLGTVHCLVATTSGRWHSWRRHCVH